MGERREEGKEEGEKERKHKRQADRSGYSLSITWSHLNWPLSQWGRGDSSWPSQYLQKADTNIEVTVTVVVPFRASHMTWLPLCERAAHKPAWPMMVGGW